MLAAETFLAETARVSGTCQHLDPPSPLLTGQRHITALPSALDAAMWSWPSDMPGKRLRDNSLGGRVATASLSNYP